MDDVAGIILAAGYSSRARDFKMTHQIMGKAVIEYVIQSMFDVCNHITVVSGFHAEKLDYLSEKYSKLQVVYNKHYDNGMFSSVLIGLRQTNEKKLFIIPGDYPAVSPETYRIMVNHCDVNILVPRYKGELGHPVLIRNDTKIQLLTGSFKTLYDYIMECGFESVDINDAGILMDIDYPDDYDEIERQLVHEKDDYNHNRGSQQRKNNSTAEIL
jgi:molybdenum cofactor cytidylyltransferase